VARRPTRDALSGARHVAERLAERGALFFEELAEAAGLLKSALEPALGELVARGFAASDSFAGLRALLVPEQKKQRYRHLAFGMEDAGRWTLIRPLDPAPPPPGEDARREAVEHAAGILLKRYGVIFRALLTREHTAPPWLDLLRVYRRLEARGEIRGGRFVAGHFGRTVRLPEGGREPARRPQADRRRQPHRPQRRRPALASPASSPPAPASPPWPATAFSTGAALPIAVLSGKQVEFLADPGDAAWELRNRLLRRDCRRD
jgi:ATP-dependent Lhr-like helicase